MYSKTNKRSNTVKISTDKDYLRLQFPSALSKKLYGKRQFFKSLGRQDTPENRKWAENLAARIQTDIAERGTTRLNYTLYGCHSFETLEIKWQFIDSCSH